VDELRDHPPYIVLSIW